jgi:hypothetical protein
LKGRLISDQVNTVIADRRIIRSVWATSCLEAQSNPLPICTRPRVLIKGKGT